MDCGRGLGARYELRKKRLEAFKAMAKLLEEAHLPEAIEMEYDKYEKVIGDRNINPLDVIEEELNRHKEWCLSTFYEMDCILGVMKTVREFEKKNKQQ